jgi:hypothetical protein
VSVREIEPPDQPFPDPTPQYVLGGLESVVVLNPDISNPDISNASLWLAPGEQAKITLRIYDEDLNDGVTFDPATDVAPAMVAQSVNTSAVDDPLPEPAVAVAFTITTGTLPEGQVNVPYGASLGVVGGEGPFTWSLLSGSLPGGIVLDPDGTLSGTATATGDYAFEVGVTDSSTPAKTDVQEVRLIIAAAGGGAPVADAGPNQLALVGASVALFGGASTDPNLLTLTFSWTMTSRPAGSSAALTGASTVSPTFIVDSPGTYVVSLVVNNGVHSSAPDLVTIETGNTPPLAVASGPGSVAAGTPAGLSSLGSMDADGDPLSFAWAFVSRPTGSLATFSDAHAPNPTFTPDFGGTYVVRGSVGRRHGDVRLE